MNISDLVHHKISQSSHIWIFSHYCKTFECIMHVCLLLLYSQWARKFKKVEAKKLVKSNKSTSRKNFLTKFHFLQFQKWPKINFWTGKKFKTAKNAISRKKIKILLNFHGKYSKKNRQIDLFDFTSFYAWTFLNFLACCVTASI